MTMLEAIAALVIFGASAVGFLGVFQNGAQSVRSAAEWNRATAVAEATLEQAVRQTMLGRMADRPVDTPAGFEAQVQSEPWSANVDDLIVRVSLPDGRIMTVHRLVRRR